METRCKSLMPLATGDIQCELAAGHNGKHFIKSIDASIHWGRGKTEMDAVSHAVLVERAKAFRLAIPFPEIKQWTDEIVAQFAQQETESKGV